MRKTTITAILSILIPAAILFPRIPVAAAAPQVNPAAKAAILAEVDSGMVLLSYKTDLPHPADALTKVMTLLLAVSACENGTADPDEIIEMTESAYNDVNAMNTPQKIAPGVKMSMLDLMYYAYIGDSIEACNLLAERISGSIRSFVSNMNSHAKELGCLKTNFTNTHGKYNERQITTAMDQFIIFREAMSHPLFVEISGSYKYTPENDDNPAPNSLLNSNELLNPDTKYYFSSCTSGIASATFEGRYSSVSFAEMNELSLICVVLGAEDVPLDDGSVELNNLSEAKRLFEWGFSTYSWRTVLSPAELICKAPVTHGAGADFVNLRPESSITLLLKNDTPDDYFKKPYIIYSVENDEPLYAPVYAGDILGEVTVVAGNGEEYGPVLLVANTNVELHRLQYINMQIHDVLSSSTTHRIIWILAILVAGYIALVVRYNILRRRRLRRIAEAKRKLVEERRGEIGDQGSGIWGQDQD